MKQIEETQNILMKWLMEDVEGIRVTVEEMHKVKKCIDAFEVSNTVLLAACEEIILFEDELFDTILEGDLGSEKSTLLELALEQISDAIAQAKELK